MFQTEGVSYLSTFLRTSQKMGLWEGPRGTNLLDSGAPFYQTYQTADGKFMAVGAIEPQFYKNFIKHLGLDECIVGGQMNKEEWAELKKRFSKRFAEKTQAEWVEIFKNTSSCVSPVLSMEEATRHPHHKERGAFVHLEDGMLVPAPSPRLSSSLGLAATGPQPQVGEHTKEILVEAGYSVEEIDCLSQERVVGQRTEQSRL